MQVEWCPLSYAVLVSLARSHHRQPNRFLERRRQPFGYR